MMMYDGSDDAREMSKINEPDAAMREDHVAAQLVLLLGSSEFSSS